ncbi:MAG: hypothetical protein M0Z47_10845 [Actinomycetota bacterium]|nr:hypothetical protein [Actinomycetota bacterium]
MAKAGYPLELETYLHRDPVTGQTNSFVRTKHARQSSERLRAHKQCVAEQMRGFTARGGDARQDSMSVRERFTQASKACAGRGGRAAAR